VLSLKRNQPTLFDDVARYFADREARVLACKPTVDADHGRIETRNAVVSPMSPGCRTSMAGPA